MEDPLFLLLSLLACTDADKSPGDPTDSRTDTTPDGDSDPASDSVPTGDSDPGSDSDPTVDQDGDGLVGADDCDDTDASIGGPILWYRDEDGDGYGDPSSEAAYCDPPAVLVRNGDDCDDQDGQVHPDAAELDCTDPTDYNCDGRVAYADVDADGTAACEDCDDADASVAPGAPERCDGADNDCDGEIDEDAEDPSIFYVDVDGDGYGDAADVLVACEAPAIYAPNGDDCDDTRSGVNPGATETCVSAYDDDCDGDLNDRDAEACVVYFEDLDGDTHGGPASACTCDPLPDYGAVIADDCDDGDAAVSPSATESCATAYDDDCDGDTNNIDAVGCEAWYLDGDGDGAYGDTSQCTCAPTGDYVGLVISDCADADPAVFPGASERCDGEDQDCDGEIDEESSDAPLRYADLDGDGFGAGAGTAACDDPGATSTNADDCDDALATVNPDADERCDTAADDDCDGDTLGVDAPDCTLWYADTDGDGFAGGDAQCACAASAAYTASTAEDCDDTAAAVHPDAVEDCATAADDDCDGAQDALDALGCVEFYVDSDGDGHGTNEAACYCVEPVGHVTSADDCDDTTSAVNPGEAEICDDGLDNNCDGGPGACGPSDTPLAAADVFYWGEAVNDYAGFDVATADLNGDGRDDVIVGSPYNDDGGADLGSAYVVLGSDTPRSITLSSADARYASTYAAGGLYIASVVANAGDVNADGHDDLLVGGDGNDVFLILGNTAPTSMFMTSADAFYEINDINSELNEAIGVGDVNGDGFGDLLLGDYFHDRGGDGAGTAFLVYGSASPSSLDLAAADVLFWGADRYEYAGYTVAGPGDVDGDGVPDLVIGADGQNRGGSSAGGAYFLSGATATTDLSLAAADALFQGEAARDEAAYVAAGGDFNADGYADVLVGAPFNDDGATDAGAAYVVLGTALPVDSSLSAAIQLRGESASDGVGTDLCSAGDQDGDGFDDVLLGVTGYGSGGAAYLVGGSASPASRSLSAADAFYLGDGGNDYAGSAVASGDHNGDGRPDLVVAAMGNDDGGTEHGTTYVLFGHGL